MAKKSSVAEPPVPTEETPPAGESATIDLDDLKPDAVIEDDDEGDTPPTPAAGEDEDEGEDDTAPAPAPDGEDEDDDDSQDAPSATDGQPPAPAADPTPADDADLAFLDDPDIYDDRGGIDPLKQAQFNDRYQSAKAAEIKRILRDVNDNIPEITPEDLAALEADLLTKSAGPREFRQARRDRIVTARILLGVNEARRNGTIPPREKEKAPPVPRRTPANATDDAPPALTSKEEGEIRAMLRANPSMDAAALRKSYLKGRKKS